MDLKQLGIELAKLGLPMLGAALPLPGGAVLGTALANYIGGDKDPDKLLAAISGNADMLQKAREFETTHQETILKIQVEAETARIVEVNKTMQTEASSDHWPTYSWRPFIGFMFGLYIASFVVLPLFHLNPVMITPELTFAVGSILGITAWFRGKMQADPNIPSDNRG